MKATKCCSKNYRENLDHHHMNSDHRYARFFCLFYVQPSVFNAYLSSDTSLGALIMIYIVHSPLLQTVVGRTHGIWQYVSDMNVCGGITSQVARNRGL